MKFNQFLMLGLSVWVLVACNSVKHAPPKHKQPPHGLPAPGSLPVVPNCAADGPGCQQFNPNKGKPAS